eukprot:NODE_223_length_1980_cov_184.352667_g178_i0.p1 GENE.NODE_223_length_1980_cov_184.352667_g178_i0~~NODE_223_length_1980_cov_184.352667_g178_i0.p1  ORF type:complete len:410 (+),score=49.40 NODE_223_length_1980_cov_184.352667_g178_i0:550-1779(+)
MTGSVTNGFIITDTVTPAKTRTASRTRSPSSAPDESVSLSLTRTAIDVSLSATPSLTSTLISSHSTSLSPSFSPSTSTSLSETATTALDSVSLSTTLSFSLAIPSRTPTLSSSLYPATGSTTASLSSTLTGSVTNSVPPSSCSYVFVLVDFADFDADSGTREPLFEAALLLAIDQLEGSNTRLAMGSFRNKFDDVNYMYDGTEVLTPPEAPCADGEYCDMSNPTEFAHARNAFIAWFAGDCCGQKHPNWEAGFDLALNLDPRPDNIIFVIKRAPRGYNDPSDPTGNEIKCKNCLNGPGVNDPSVCPVFPGCYPCTAGYADEPTPVCAGKATPATTELKSGGTTIVPVVIRPPGGACEECANEYWVDNSMPGDGSGSIISSGNTFTAVWDEPSLTAAVTSAVQLICSTAP